MQNHDKQKFDQLPAGVADVALLNMTTISDLCSLDGPQDLPATFLAEIVAGFEKNFITAFDDLRRVRSAGDVAAIQHLAHKLKGMSHNVGGQRLAEIADRLETTARAGRLPEDTLFVAFESTFSATKNALQGAILQRREQLEVVPESISSLLLSAVEGQSIFSIDAEGYVKSWNQRAASIFGYSKEDIVGKHFSVFYPEEARKAGIPDANLRAALRDGRFEEEGIRLRKDGSTYWAQVVIVPAYDDSGKLTGFVKFRRDITAYKKSQEQMRNFERRLQAFFANVQDAIGFLDSANRLADCNPAFCALVGATKADLLAEGGYESLTPLEYRADDLARRRLVTDESKILQYEKEIFRVGGSRVPVHVTLFALPDQDGGDNVAAVIIRDISAAKMMHAEIVNARTAALESARVKSAFLANISHEIRTPLNGIIGLTSLLSKMPVSEEAKEYIGGIRSSGEHLLGIVNEILDFSRIEAGKLPLEKIEFNTRDVVEEAFAMYIEEARTRQLAFTVTTLNSVPQYMVGDPTKVRQILFNLISNAFKFTARGGIDIVVSVVDTNAGFAAPRLRLDVRDTGIGIAVDALQKIFKPFVQADASTTRRFGGTGLGLMIVKKLAELMGGQVGVDSTPGVGSCFWFEVPLGAALPNVNAVRPDFAGKKVLWLGDRQHIFCALHLQLQNRGLELVYCNDVAPASHKDFDFSVEASPASLTIHYRDRHEILLMPFRQSDLYRKLDVLVNGARPMAAMAAHDESTLSVDLAARVANKRVLVVDDNHVNQKVAMRMLEKFGIVAEKASNGLEALAAVRQGKYDLVLMDCLMPELDGYAATREIRKLSGELGQIPIVAMTANPKKSDNDKCVEAGMNDYLEKPIRIENMLAIVKHWLSPLSDDEIQGKEKR